MRRPLDGRAAPSDTWTLPEGLAGIAVFGDELLREGDGEPDFAIAGIAERGDVILLTGREKDSAKTFLALDLAIACVLGACWLGREVKRCAPARVLFISCETSARNISRRLRLLCAGRGIDAAKVAPFIVVVDQPITLIPREARDRLRDKAHLHTQLAAAKMFDPTASAQLRNNADGVAAREVRGLGRNLTALEAIENAPPGTWGLVVVDTLRQCLEGDENSSADAAKFTQAARELGRAADCPVLVIHHTNKSGDASDARSSRGSVEFTAGPDALLSADTTGDNATLHFKLRNHEAPDAVGYALAKTEHGLAIEVRAACAGSKGGVSAEHVLASFQGDEDAGLTVSTIRSRVAEERDGKPGSKASAKTVERCLSELEKRKAVSRCEIKTTNGKSLDGWRLGTAGGTVRGSDLRREKYSPFVAPPGFRQ